jgi:uncharacterized membrane protein
MTAHTASAIHDVTASRRWGGYLLGFSMGGFFDGILLHQILQWHHLLSGLEREGFADLRVQILADGLFHLLMYVLALAGLVLLWRSRAEPGRPAAGRMLLAAVLIGFGAWHVLDAVASHWLLGIHRIHMESPNPLFWDLLWFVVFGVLFIAAGWWLRGMSGGGRSRGHRGPAALTGLVLAMGAGAAISPAGDMVLVVFRPGLPPAQALAAVASVDGELVWSDPSDQVWAVAMPEEASVFELYRNGALLVGGSLLPAGCLNWTRI